jgi:TonB family protein
MRRQLLVCVISVTTLVAADFQPARFSSGSLPLPPQQAIGWLEVVMQVTVGAAGVVESIEALRATEPLAGILRPAIDRWRFEPALEDGHAVGSQVLVAAVYRPATFFNTPSLGEPPRDLAPPSRGIPFPTFAPAPAYPPRALGDGVVLLELLVGMSGEVRTAHIMRSSGTGFNSIAMRTAARWQFRPARRGGGPVPAFAYLIFGFRQPVVADPRPR